MCIIYVRYQSERGYKMKRITSCAAAIAFAFVGVCSPVCRTPISVCAADSTAYTASDAKAAVKRAFNEINVTNSVTYADILEVARNAVPSDITVEAAGDLVITKATAGLPGIAECSVKITDSLGNSVVLEHEFGIEALGWGDSDEDDNGGQSDSKSDSDGTKDDSTMSASEAKKLLEKASHEISTAVFDFDVSNDTTKDDVLKMAKSAIADYPDVSAKILSSDFSIIKSTYLVEGSMSATITLTCAGQSKRCPVGKTVPLAVTEESTKLNEDWSLVGKAIGSVKFTNKITKEELMNVAQKAVKNGSTVTLKSYNKIDATFKEKGNVTLYVDVTLGEYSRELRSSDDIPMLVRTFPSDGISITKVQWEILYQVNYYRAKEGAKSLTMVAPLQDACEIRAKEATDSHYRPDGTRFDTAIPSSFKYASSGENLFKCSTTINDADLPMNGWMNSEGHHANIVNSAYSYIGVGLYKSEAVQIFAGTNEKIVSVSTGSGKMNYADEETMMRDYLICRTASGVVSYMPLDSESMTKVNGGYKPNINMDNPPVITIGNASAADVTAPKDDNTLVSAAPVFSDVAASDYFSDAVKWAVERKITNGTSDTTFSPNDTCTRAQIITFLWRAVGSPNPNGTNPYTDINANDYYYNAAVWAAEKGMVDGKAFAPNTPCTRASTVMYLWIAAGSPDCGTTNKFGDVSTNDSYAQAVAWAVENNVTSGTSDVTFSPDMICNRGQIVTFLRRANS